MMALPASRRREDGMLAPVSTGAVVGLDGALVEVEVDIAAGGMPTFLVVGLPDAAVPAKSAQGPSTTSIPASTSWT
jgi:hypothetical protein